MATKRLVSTDGALAKATKGTEITGNSSTALTEGWYVATTILGSGSGLPDGIETGYFFYASTAAAITPATGEKVLPITFSTMCDITSATIEYSKGEVDVTTLCDEIKVYRGGMVDASGTIEGITTIGVTDQSGGIIQKFISTIRQDSDLEGVTITTVDDDPIFLQLKINKESTNGEDVAFFFFPATILGYSAGATVGDNAQTFSSNFRITTDDDIEPQFFELAQAVV